LSARARRRGARAARAGSGRAPAILALALGFAAVAAAAWWFSRDGASARGTGEAEAAAPEAAPDAARPRPAEGVRPAAEPAAREASVPEPPSGTAVVSEEPSATGSVRVTVRDASGKPAFGIGLVLWNEARATPHAFPLRSGTDAEGVATFERVPAGPVVVRGDRSGEARAKVDEGRATELELSLAPGRLVHGRTLDAAGRLVAHADVWLFRDAGDRGGALVATSDNAGRYDLEHAPDGAWLVARADGKSPSAARAIPASEGSVAVDLSLGESGAKLIGQVVDAREAPIAGAAVCVLPERAAAGGEGPEPWFASRTDGEGRFQIAGIEYGRARLVALFPGFAPHDERVELRPSGRDERVLRLAPGGAVGGRVRTTGGSPAAGVEVRFGDARDFLALAARTHDDGSFLLRDLPPGLRELDVGGTRLQVEIVAGDLASISPRVNR
jgi:hypothetical protein